MLIITMNMQVIQDGFFFQRVSSAHELTPNKPLRQTACQNQQKLKSVVVTANQQAFNTLVAFRQIVTEQWTG